MENQKELMEMYLQSTTENQREIIEMYSQITEESKDKLFTKEQRKTLDGMSFFAKLFSNPEFYKAVEETIAEEIYKTICED